MKKQSGYGESGVPKAVSSQCEKGQYQPPQLVELGSLAQLIRGNTGAFADGNSNNPRRRPPGGGGE